ncbi:hypothetical protein CCM_04378 [Cordyceps militaris CM01]|uniref:Uncharacterized protein n=1 Tax=Cordyceps militaris (strain CM01) TaxID=983644 RepID=G3JEP7_CORMM|nr:uncharacterized protein CCM_04378 [Cordyceps militaris CM01]EGX93006.1 hypothetical protein CCM_04378 [Cordyceps militaris CM01]
MRRNKYENVLSKHPRKGSTPCHVDVILSPLEAVPSRCFFRAGPSKLTSLFLLCSLFLFCKKKKNTVEAESDVMYHLPPCVTSSPSQGSLTHLGLYDEAKTAAFL